MGVVGQSNFAG